MATPAWARCSVAILCIALFLAHLSTAAAQAPHYTLHSPPLRTLHHRPSVSAGIQQPSQQPPRCKVY
ncbi:MAG: hypothetical protein WDW38_003559 [Sanguina aurantia]